MSTSTTVDEMTETTSLAAHITESPSDIALSLLPRSVINLLDKNKKMTSQLEKEAEEMEEINSSNCTKVLCACISGKNEVEVIGTGIEVVKLSQAKARTTLDKAGMITFMIMHSNYYMQMLIMGGTILIGAFMPPH